MTNFPLVQRRSEQVLSVLRERLTQADVTPGSRLPPERVLAEELKVSRRVLREALQTLEDENLIERLPGRGTVIMADGSQEPDGFPLADIRQYTSPLELMDARFALEPAIAAMAAAHATSQDIDDMRLAIEHSKRRLADYREWEKWDGAFHSAIGTATHNNILIHFFTVLIAAREQTAWGRLRQRSLTPERQSLYIHQHTLILAAIEERNPEQAARTMRQHLTTVRRTLIDQLDDA